MPEKLQAIARQRGRSFETAENPYARLTSTTAANCHFWPSSHCETASRVVQTLLLQATLTTLRNMAGYAQVGRTAHRCTGSRISSSSVRLAKSKQRRRSSCTGLGDLDSLRMAFGVVDDVRTVRIPYCAVLQSTPWLPSYVPRRDENQRTLGCLPRTFQRPQKQSSLQRLLTALPTPPLLAAAFGECGECGSRSLVSCSVKTQQSSAPTLHCRGLELAFQRVPGVVSTWVGYTQGHTDKPTYSRVCSGSTGHTEAVLVTYDPAQVSYKHLLQVCAPRIGQFM